MGIAIRKDDKEMVEKVNKALDEIIKDGTYEKISKNGLGVIFLVKRKKRSNLALQSFHKSCPTLCGAFHSLLKSIQYEVKRMFEILSLPIPHS